jgi:hypothetical protein
VTGGTPPAEPVSFIGDHQSLTFGLQLRDVTSGEQAFLGFSGELTGLLGHDSSTLVLEYTTHGWAEARLGDMVYRVWMPDEVPVPSWSAGSVSFTPQLTVRAAGASEQTPEPSTLALGAAAALGLAARRWLRRRAGAA